MDNKQMSMLFDIDRYEEGQIREKLRKGYEYAYRKMNGRDLPDGLVVIMAMDRYYIEHRTKTHFYRCVVGHHDTVSGPMVHVISAPNKEWPDEPIWQYDNRHGCRWTYPTGEMWVNNEPEYDPEVKWHD